MRWHGKGGDSYDERGIDHFRVALNLIVKTRLGAKFLLLYQCYCMKISFHSNANKTNYHMKSFALSLAFIVRFTATRKWPIKKTVHFNFIIPLIYCFLNT